MEVVMGKMTNVPQLLSRLREVSRCMALPFPSAAQEVLIACRALADTTEAESAEIAAAGLDFAEAAEGDLQDASPTCILIIAAPVCQGTPTLSGSLWSTGRPGN